MKKALVNLSSRNFQTDVGHMMQEEQLKREILHSVSNQINKECRAVAKDKSFMHVKKVTDIYKFSFDDILLKLKQSCPLTNECLS